MAPSNRLRDMNDRRTEKLYRSSTSKVRTGCVTCKARRVKCDEGRPSCKRCKSAARTCEGYEIPKVIEPSSMSLKIKFYVSSPQDFSIGLVPFEAEQKERRAFAFFCERTAKCFRSEFSSLYLLQAANEEPAIRHAIIALGAMHEFYGLDNEGQSRSSAMNPFSKQQYGKAIKLLLHSTSSLSEHAIEVFLITCILFACFESLQGHIKSAITHVRCGLKLLRQKSTTDALSRFTYIPQSTIRSLFTSLDNQMMGLGGSLLLTALRAMGTLSTTFSAFEIPETFQSLEGAYENFEIVLNCTLRVRRNLEMVLADPLYFPDAETLLLRIEIERQKCLQYLDRWSLVFNQYLIHHGSHDEWSVNYEIRVLQIWRVAAKIFLSAKHTDGEETWDRFWREFNTIVTLIEALLEIPYTKNALGPGSPSFSFHLGILTPLFLTCIRCRDPGIRRRAFNILSSLRRCEGIWDSLLAAKVAKKVIDVEGKFGEQGSPGFETCRNHNVSADNTQVHRRVKTVEVEYDDTSPRVKLD